MKTTSCLFAVAAVLATAFSQPSLAERVGVRVGGVAIDVGVPPPAPVVEVVPPPRRDYVWIPGYWAWQEGRHVWVRGFWERERPGWVRVPPRWEERGGRWHWDPGGWVRR